MSQHFFKEKLYSGISAAIAQLTLHAARFPKKQTKKQEKELDRGMVNNSKYLIALVKPNPPGFYKNKCFHFLH